MAKQISDLIVERLIEWGVDTIFGFPGDGVDGFFESLRTHQDKLKFIQVRHEEAAAFAAVGYAKYTGRLGVCCATSGPGGVHLLNGLYDAKCDLQPVLAITGHTFPDLIGMDYQQDVDLDKLYMDVSVFNERIMGASTCRQRRGHGSPDGLRKARCFAHLYPEGYTGVESLRRPSQQRERSATTAAIESPSVSQACRIRDCRRLRMSSMHGSKVVIFCRARRDRLPRRACPIGRDRGRTGG